MSDPIWSKNRSKRRLVGGVLGLIALFAVAAVLIGVYRQDVPPPTEQEARRAFLRGDYAEAERLAVAVGNETGRSEFFLMAAEAASHQNRHAEALDYYTLVRGEDPRHGVDHLIEAGDALMRGRRPSAAEAKFRLALERSPRAAAPRDRLATLLLITARRHEAVPLLLDGLKRGQNSVHTLCLLGQTEGANALPSQFEAIADRKSDEADLTADPLPLLAVASKNVEDGDWTAARDRLLRVLQRNPTLIEANVLLGQVYLETGDTPGFDQWTASLSEAALEHPAVWYLEGVWAERNEQPSVAARAFWESLRREPEDTATNYRLGRTLQALGREDEARPFLERAALLERLSSLAEILYTSPNDLERLKEASDITLRLGRLWEAWGWARIANQIDPNTGWSSKRIQTLESRFSESLPRTLASHRPAEKLDLSDLPLPRRNQSIAGTDRTAPTADDTTLNFSNDAAQVGLVMSYQNGSPPGRAGHRMHEITGGGVAAVDYDRDGRADLFATQGRSFPSTATSDETDRLFRNLGNTFADVTVASGSEETNAIGFGQGVTTGDWNADGFPDLYIANIGQNRLLRNNGDGTFQDVTEHAGIPAPPLTQAWTTSVVMADVTGDGLADLFDVNYVTADDVYERVCSGRNGIPRSCPPTQFASCQDRLLVNLGDGRFEDQTTAAGLVAKRGNGLGIVAADFTGDSRLGLFVANDQTPNHFFVPASTSTTPLPFEERATPCGLAFDGEGNAQACMGVAADDADGDGSLDLLVTNFYLEANTLYCQRETALFEDATVRAGLRDPSYDMLGFGAQFLDADRDGWPDLLVTNGHIDDFTALGIPYRMRPQLFRNSRGQFREVAPETLNPFFRSESLGRGMARLDWNGDGLDDAAISHLDAPLALLTNRSQAGRGFGVLLVATRSERTAIGTTVTATSSNGVRTRQLTAGDGYMASNERRLGFGLGESTAADVQVRWPSGATESFGRVDAGANWLLVEGRGRPLRLSKHRNSTPTTTQSP